MIICQLPPRQQDKTTRQDSKSGFISTIIIKWFHCHIIIKMNNKTHIFDSVDSAR